MDCRKVAIFSWTSPATASRLYDSDNTDLPEPQLKTPTQAPAIAQEYFKDWLPSAGRFESAAKAMVDEGGLKEAAFQLHQATERYYHCVLLVSPSTRRTCTTSGSFVPRLSGSILV